MQVLLHGFVLGTGDLCYEREKSWARKVSVKYEIRSQFEEWIC